MKFIQFYDKMSTTSSISNGDDHIDLVNAQINIDNRIPTNVDNDKLHDVVNDNTTAVESPQTQIVRVLNDSTVVSKIQ